MRICWRLLTRSVFDALGPGSARSTRPRLGAAALASVVLNATRLATAHVRCEVEAPPSVPRWPVGRVVVVWQRLRVRWRLHLNSFLVEPRSHPSKDIVRAREPSWRQRLNSTQCAVGLVGVGTHPPTSAGGNGPGEGSGSGERGAFHPSTPTPVNIFANERISSPSGSWSSAASSFTARACVGELAGNVTFQYTPPLSQKKTKITGGPPIQCL